MDDEKKLYARAHEAIMEQIPLLKGEILTRERWWRLLNINPNNPHHTPFKKAVNQVLWNLSEHNKKKVLEKDTHGYKIVDDTLVEIDFRTSDPTAKLDLVLPLGIHQYCYLYRRNIMVLFGSKDAGKTAWILNIIRYNMNRYPTFLWSSEMCRDELHNRLIKCEGIDINDWNFKAYERSYDFDQVIEPNGLNLIDFLELGGDDSEYYKGVALIRKAYDKLDNGVLIIACQKNHNALLPKGGAGLLEKARIAISLDPNKATIAVAKNWADGVKTSPRGLSWTYQLVGGINIVNPQRCVEDF